MALANAHFSTPRAQPVIVIVLVLCLTLSSYAFTQTHSNTDAAPVSRYPSHQNDPYDALHAIDDDVMVYARIFAFCPLMTPNFALCVTALLCMAGCLFAFTLSRDIGGRALTFSLFALMASTLCAATDYDLSQPQMAVSGFDTCYVQYGQVVCWGDNQYGNLGRGDDENIGWNAGDLNLILTAIDLGPNFIVKQFAGGSVAHHCAVSIDGRLKCFGRNNRGQCGYGNTKNRGDDPNELGLNLLDVDLGEGFVVDSVSLGNYHTCALSTNHTAKCFGRGAYGALGIGDTTESDRGDEPNQMGDYLPLLVFPNAFVPVQISAASYSSCVASVDGRVCCFGSGSFGMLGQGNTDIAYAPVLVDLGNGFVVAFVSVGALSACAVSVDGSMKCWGYNYYAQLGYNHTDTIGDDPNEMGSNLLIVNLGSSFVVKQVSSGYAHRCVLSIDGRVKCFGWGEDGQLGSGSEANILSNVTGDDLPTVDFGIDFNVTALATGEGDVKHHCALSVTAGMRCWGFNNRGQLGVGDTEDRLSPVTPLIQIIITTASPTQMPTTLPTSDPSAPTSDPTTEPTTVPTHEPTALPTSTPTVNPSTSPSSDPTAVPTTEPTRFPSSEPSFIPTSGPTVKAETTTLGNDSETDASEQRHLFMIGGAVALSLLML